MEEKGQQLEKLEKHVFFSNVERSAAERDKSRKEAMIRGLEDKQKHDLSQL